MDIKRGELAHFRKLNETIKQDLKSAKNAGEIQKIYIKYPQLVEQNLSFHHLGLDNYAKCMKVLHPEKCIASNPTEMQALIKETCDDFLKNPKSESSFKAKMIILTELNPKLFKECLEKKQLEAEYLPYCQSAYETSNMRHLIKNACKLTNSGERIKTINTLNHYNETIFNNCYNAHYLSKDMEKVEEALKVQQKKELNNKFNDESTTMKSLMVCFSKISPKPNDLVNNLKYLRNLNPKLAQECFNNLDPNTKKIYCKAIKYINQQIEGPNKIKSKEISK